MFDKATLRLSSGRALVISRIGHGIYVDQVLLDGIPYSSSWLPVEKIHPGTTHLEFKMSTQPNKTRGSVIGDRPPSFR